MRRLFVGLGALAFLIGLVWSLQGADVLLGSSMSGCSFWLAVGLALVLVGAVVAVVGARLPGTTHPA